jgi:tetratricopeptide (TPR) repeat protein
LRDHVSEREKLRIAAFYHSYVTGDTGQAIAAYRLWTQSYPRDPLPLASLASLHALLGQYDTSVGESLEAQRLDPDSVLIYSNLGSDYLALGRRQEAKKAFDQAAQQKVDGSVLRLARYELAFLEGDLAGMAAQLAWSAHEPGEGIFLSSQSDTEAYYGHLHKARELSRRAVEASGRSDMSEAAAIWEASAALRESDFGNPELARRGAQSALGHSTGKQLWALAALAFARSGDSARAESLVQKLQQNYPSDTLLRYYWLPVIHGSIDLRRGDPVKALESLQVAAPYDLADPFPISSSPLGNMYSVYVRGQAYLQAHRVAEAATEFQKILNQPGLVLNGPIGALARAELARAYAAEGDAATPSEIYSAKAASPASPAANDDPKAKARAQYEAFFALWEDADPDIPFLKEAKAAYAKMK